MKKKRRLFDELMEGIDALQQQREGKIILRSHEVENLPPLEVDAEIIRDTRAHASFQSRVCAPPACINADTGELGARPGSTQCPGGRIDLDGKKIS